jgi:hypothetical protein
MHHMMKNTFKIMSLLLIVYLFSCNNKNEKNMTKSDDTKETKSIEPVILKEYPKEIDSVIKITLDAHYSALNTEYRLINLKVGHGVGHSKKSIGDSIIFDGEAVNYDMYDVLAETECEDSIDKWGFFISKDYKIIAIHSGPIKK